MTNWTTSVKLQLVLEFIRVYRVYCRIKPGTVQRGGDDLGDAGQLLESLAYTPEYSGEWELLKDTEARVNVELVIRTLEVILARMDKYPALAKMLPSDYRKRLKLKLV